PATKLFDDLDHAAIGTHEEHVDREPHPEGVNGSTWRKHERMAVGECVTTKQSLAAALRIKRRFDDVGDHRSGADVEERARPARRPERSQERTHWARAVCLACVA